MARKHRKRRARKSFIRKLLAFAALVAILFFLFGTEKGRNFLEFAGETDFSEIATMTQEEILEKIEAGFSGNGKENPYENKPSSSLDGDLIYVDFIDVGQGDSALITTDKNHYVLVDAGPDSSKDKLVKYLRSKGVKKIDYFFMSHPHSDHIGGAAEILENFDVKNIIMPDASNSGSYFTNLLKAIARKKQETGCKVLSAKAGDAFNVDGLKIDLAAPIEIHRDNLNNCSIVMTVKYKDFSVLFTGDAEKDVERQILRSGADIDCDILKSGHHGSSSSSSVAFLSAVSPDVAVISCEKNNSYGHPHRETIKAYKDNDIRYFITADNGTVTVISNGEEYDIVTER